MKTIKLKISIAMLGLVIVIMAAMVVIFGWVLQKSSTSAIENTVETQAKQSATNFDCFVRESVHDFVYVVETHEFHSAENDAKMVDLLSDKLSDNPYMVSFAIFNANGSLSAQVNSICSTFITTDDINIALNRRDTYLTPIKTDGGYSCFCAVTPIIEDDKIDKFAVTAIDAKLINNKLTSLLGSDGVEIMVVDRSGEVIFHTGGQATGRNIINVAKSDKDYEQFADAVSTGINCASGNTDYKFNGQNYIMGFSSVSYFEGTLFAYAVNDGIASMLSFTSLRIIVLLIVLLALITIAFALVFSNKISKPIISTTDRLRRLSNGDISTRVDVWYSHDELGILSNSLEETVVNLRQYINLIQVALQQIAEGNLTHRMEGNFKGDFLRIKSTFNEIFEKLTVTFDSINHSAEQVTNGAIQVSNSAQALSQGATEQASAIEELSATLSGVSDQVVQNSQNAKDAFEIVSENTSAIAGCNDDMTKMLEAMELIDHTSDEIASILKVIDDISFQTNILALNAAVEAAREGSKGFGVVADEVRQLASRSAEAAKQTAALIRRSTDAVDQGQQIAKETARSLGDIVESSEKIRKLVKNIARASSEQSDSIQQINMGVDQISAVVASNTATAVGSASASEELSGQSLILKNMIARFKLDGNSTPHIRHVNEDEPFDDGYREPEDDDDDEDIVINIDDVDDISDIDIDDDDDKY